MNINRQVSFGVKGKPATAERNTESNPMLKSLGISGTPRSEMMNKGGLTIIIPESPRHEAGSSENNPEFGLPVTSDCSMPPVKVVGPPKTCTFGPIYAKRKQRCSAFFGGPADLSSAISSSEASLPKQSPFNALIENKGIEFDHKDGDKDSKQSFTRQFTRSG